MRCPSLLAVSVSKFHLSNSLSEIVSGISVSGGKLR
jgi:hypothetical protein